MFEPKQSDYWFIEDTDDFLLCTVSSVSAESDDPCKQDPIAIYPVIYRINRDTNKKKTLFPSGSAQLTTINEPGYVNNLVPEVSANINVTEISKPQISYNKTRDLYNITFTGKYSDNDLAIFSYVFQYNSNLMHLVDSYALVPEAKNHDVRFTFDNGNLHPDYIIKGNKTSNSDTFFGTGSSNFVDYVPPDYQLAPFHYGDDLRFASTVYSTASTELSGDDVLPISYAGGFITQKRLAKGVSTENCIRVDFTLKCYSITSTQKGLWSDSTATGSPLSASRNTTLYTLNTEDYLGEGFCIFFYEPQTELFPIYIDTQNSKGIGYQDIVGIGTTTVIEDPGLSELELNGVGKTMGYVPASANVVEYNALSPFKSNGIRAKGYLAICFDLAGFFCTIDDGMPDRYDGGTTFTQSSSTIGIRGGENNDYKVLGRSGQISSIPMHEWVASASAATYKYFRVELIKNGTFVKVLGKENEGDSFTLLYSLDIKDYYTEVPKQLKAGLTFNTTNRIANFELNEFKVDGTFVDTSGDNTLVTSSTPVPTTDRRYNTTISSNAIQDCLYQTDYSGIDNCIYSTPVTQVATSTSTTCGCTCCC